MTVLRFLFVLLLVVQGCQSRKEAPHPLTGKLDAIFSAHPEFSGVILVADKGRPIFHKAIGYRSVEDKILLDTTTVFELASVSKQFTAMIIMMLKEEGKLDYDELLEKYIPGLPYPGITIRHLLNHTSGLPLYEELMDKYWDKTRVAGNDDIIAYLKLYHPEKRFEPGDKYEYCNTGYVLLGTIAEVASGKNFVAMARDRIFTPLGMTSTDIRTLEEKAAVSNFARAYMYVPGKHRYIRADSFPSSNYIVWLGNRKGPGRVSSTTSDLLRWDRALYTTKLIKQETLQDAFTSARLNNDSISTYGFGWNTGTIRARTQATSTPAGKMVWHTGSNPGYANIIVRYIDADLTIIRLCNNDYAGIPAIDRALDSLLSVSSR